MPLLEASVIIATSNPQHYVIQWVLDGLASQTLAHRCFEVVVVDNNSRPPLEADTLLRARDLILRVVNEPRQGVTFARCAGIVAARSDLLLFVDDDNYLDPDYLERAVAIARVEPTIGAFGGIARFLSEGHIPAWKQALLPYVGIRDYGGEVITSNEDRWGQWEPIGAGMVFRRDIGMQFVERVKMDSQAQLLGRCGNSFICGEDSLLARLAYPLGYSCSYQPTLKLTHFIKSSRLTAKHLARTIEGVARAFVLYEAVLGRPAPRHSLHQILRELYSRCIYRIRSRGLRAGFIEWFWDVGYFRQSRLLKRPGCRTREAAH